MATQLTPREKRAVARFAKWARTAPRERVDAFMLWVETTNREWVNVPKPSRRSETWLRRQLATLSEPR
jgi:hypothetical protein